MPPLRLSDFDYDLPVELIAQAPAERRDGSRLMFVPASGAYAHHPFRELPGLLAPGSLVVLNDTRVLPARLYARKPTGGRVELLLVEPEGPTPARNVEIWRCLIRGAKSLAPGDALTVLAPRGGSRPSLDDEAPPLAATYLGRAGDAGRVEFRAPEGLVAALEHWGEVPLPPYIERPGGTTPYDRERYQTVFARAPGAVAAPTAGLHFTDAVFAALAERGVECTTITLHVGPGTFAPVRDEDLAGHMLHAERYSISAASALAVNQARREGRPVVAVGTTVVRTLEGACDGAGVMRPGAASTRLFIQPGFSFRVVDRLVTNFHIPRSTLFMLVCAFAGRERMLAAYAEAVARRYRFYSYGDAMLLDRAFEVTG